MQISEKFRNAPNRVEQRKTEIRRISVKTNSFTIKRGGQNE